MLICRGKDSCFLKKIKKKNLLLFICFVLFKGQVEEEVKTTRL